MNKIKSNLESVGMLPDQKTAEKIRERLKII